MQEKEIHEHKKVQEELIKTRKMIKEQQVELEQERWRKERIMTCLRERFSPAQLDRILDDKESRWSQEDFQKANTLLCGSEKAYKMTRELLNVPLPARSAVKRWIAENKLVQGNLEENDEK